ncbi:MAG: hypothetical protein EOO03_05935 [Chitinophagaceae bacterium]|nr:MAG: hypothetical protein EOO03_05935 [Chitinophagaceae bacterium]
MRELLYNIYTNITENEFFAIKAKLIDIELQMLKLIGKSGWAVSESVETSDALIVNFLLDDGAFMGNMGIKINDVAGVKLFDFYVTKGFDVGNKRHFVRKYIFKSQPYSHFGDAIEKFTNQALLQYDMWTKELIEKEAAVIDMN